MWTSELDFSDICYDTFCFITQTRESVRGLTMMQVGTQNNDYKLTYYIDIVNPEGLKIVDV